MASVINTNMASLYAQKNLSGAQNALATSVERLSSGLRINRAKDDAAGLGISEKIKSQVTALNQGVRNANDAISMVQAAEGSLSEVSTILQRMKELSVQARNESLSTTQRSYISDELVALKKEINAIAERTTFNDLSLLKNALRTDVVSSAATNQLQNGASVLDGITVAGVTLKNTNAGTYSFSTGTVEQITGQLSRASSPYVGVIGTDSTQTVTSAQDGTSTATITLSGVYEVGDIVSFAVDSTSGTATSVNYTVLAEDLTLNGDGTGGNVNGGSSYALNNIANKLKDAFTSAATGALGASITETVSGAVVSFVGDGAKVTAAKAFNRQPYEEGFALGEITNSGTSANTVTLSLAGTFKAGDVVSLGSMSRNGSSVGSVSYTVLASDISGSGNDATTLSNVLAGVSAAYTASTISSASITVARDGSNLRFSVTGANSSIGVTTGTTAVADLFQGRKVTIAPDDIAEGNRITLTIAGKDYTVVAGSESSVGSIATALQGMLAPDYATGTGSSVNATAGTIDLEWPGFATTDISMSVKRFTDGAAVSNISSVVNDAHISNQAVARTITINNNDVVEGRKFTVTIGNPETSTSYSVVADHDDTAVQIAQKLEDLMDNNLGEGSATGTGTTVAASVALGGSVGVITIGSGASLGMSTITISVNDMVESESLRAVSTVESKTRAETARTITINQNDMAAGNVVSVTIRGKEYAVQVDATDNNNSVAYKLGSLIDNDFPNRDANTATVDFPAATRNSVTNNVITLTSSAKLGLEDIAVSVRKITNPGVLTVTANADTGIGGTKQSINIGTIAAGGSKTFDFDNLGISFTLNNTRATAVNSASFAAYSSRVNQLNVGAVMDGEALFQVGAGTRDTVVLDGFKDIRITGYNQNSGAEKAVFDNVNATLNTIAQNTTESLSEANFATLENQIEDAITTIADFRGYFGAQQNRIEFAISNIQAQSENLAAANSRIVDTDYAAETANLTKTQIMQQAATAMLAQANQMPNVILALLK